jgi:hypothetical protein
MLLESSHEERDELWVITDSERQAVAGEGFICTNLDETFLIFSGN